VKIFEKIKYLSGPLWQFYVVRIAESSRMDYLLVIIIAYRTKSQNPASGLLLLSDYHGPYGDILITLTL